GGGGGVGAGGGRGGGAGGGGAPAVGGEQDAGRAAGPAGLGPRRPRRAIRRASRRTSGAGAPPSEASDTQGEPQDQRGWGPAVRGERYIKTQEDMTWRARAPGTGGRSGGRGARRSAS